MELKSYFKSIVGKCFHLSTPLDYPHGKMVAIVPVEYREDTPYSPMLICYVSFTDGYMGSYSYYADDVLYNHFKKLNPYN